MLQKLLFTVIAIAVVWFGFRYYARFVAGPARRRAVEREAAPPSQPPQKDSPVVDMVQCQVCSAYLPAKGVARCGRPDCPF